MGNALGDANLQMLSDGAFLSNAVGTRALRPGRARPEGPMLCVDVFSGFRERQTEQGSSLHSSEQQKVGASDASSAARGVGAHGPLRHGEWGSLFRHSLWETPLSRGVSVCAA